ncbi:ankyrin repeat domain-containing protein 65-like [Schistocerca cancellata]|uniref:ankyrin repeat domain-containing protein 65-like n=1 Tax=Schistocerca cancellata TaxID=274614 RepID=UPI002117447C|nr:ankyrin repeat domain-containing protein 65-like [Schistocerca cancellata]
MVAHDCPSDPPTPPSVENCSGGGRSRHSVEARLNANRKKSIKKGCNANRDGGLQSLSAKERDRRLVQAAEQRAVGELRALIAAGADVGVRGEWGRTALHCAAQRGDVEVARLLVGAGAEVDARTDLGWTPLHLAALNGRAEVAAALLAAGADRRATTDVGGWTALDIARLHNHRRLVEMLS